MTPQEFLEQFTFGGLLTVAIGPPTARRYFNADDLSTLTVPPDVDVYFGPAMCKTAGAEKKDVLGTKVLWVDVDDVGKPLCTLTPSIAVFSGHGWHLYWILAEPLLDVDTIEALNKTLMDDVHTGGDSCWNCNRVLRVPGTTNTKEEGKPISVELRNWRPGLIYTPQEIGVIGRLNKQDKHKITTGDRRGFRSRSERDWAILTALVVAGAADELIHKIFAEHPCGDKAKENDHYLPHTIEAIRAKDLTPVEGDDIVERDDGYYVPARKGFKRISTFLFDPLYLLDGSSFGAADALVGDVSAEGFEWLGVTFSRSAFTSVNKLDKEAPVAAWQFLGHDDELRRLLPYFLQKLKGRGLPKIAATPVLGLHNIKGAWRFLGTNQALSDTQLWEQYQGPICWLPSQKEHPELDLTVQTTPDEILRVAKSLPLLNEPGTIWPMIGWYTASCLKPWFEAHNYRFPILNVSGTKGSGKTSLIQRVFMPLMGQTNPKTYDAGTTKFIILCLLGATNAVPIAFSEFRYGSVENFIRFILLAYDTGHDPRGRGDQTTVDYPLSAPFSVDGEDLIDDPAARERIVVAQLHPEVIDEGTVAYTTFQELRNNMPKYFGGYMIQEILKLEPLLVDLLSRARTEVFEAFPAKLPDRVRNNHVVTYLGVLLWCRILGVNPPPASVMERSIASVFNIKSGRARTLADAMVEDLINGIAQGFAHLNYVYDNTTNTVWFQLAPAHTWWITSRRRQGRGSLERDAIRAQLKEAPYSVEPHVMNDAWMYGVDLQVAVDNGLDVPSKISDNTFVVRM